MTVEKINERFSQGAVEMLLDDYCKQKKTIQYLPESEDFRESLLQKTNHLFNKGTGFCFYENDVLLGFMAGYTVKNFFGSSDGVCIPLYGHCISSKIKSRADLYQKMYAYAAGNWVDSNLLSHVITVFATDRELVDTWFDLGFGNRCVDAIRETKEIPSTNKAIIVRKAEKQDIDSLEELYKRDCEYFSSSPLFMPQFKIPSINTLQKWFETEMTHLWIAYYEGIPAGYLKIEEKGESYIVEHPSIMNITGAYVSEELRGKGIASTLLNESQKWLRENNFKLCGVDFESFNIAGNAFWNRYFSSYTYSLARRIDENILKTSNRAELSE